jgi:DNA topoisomerase-3
VGKTLIITEKPSVARDVAAALPGHFAKTADGFESDEHVVAAARGHLVEEAPPEVYDPRLKRWRYEDLPIIPGRFELRPRSEGDAKKQLRVLHRLIARPDVEEIVNACDAGREGELIFKLIIDTAKKGADKPIRRAWFSSMTRQAIRDAFEHLRDDDQMKPLEAAARSRSEADWLVGYNATRAATTRTGGMRNIITLGRVQTPTLALIARRDEEIDAFVPEDYWQVRAIFETALGDRYVGLWHQGSRNRLDEEAKAAAIVEAVRAAARGRVDSVTRKPVVQQPPLLYDLTTLQREANQRLGWSAKRTLDVAQRCYDQYKVLTYPRTDSRFLTSDMIPTLKPIAGHIGRASGEYTAASQYVRGLDKLPLGRVVNDAKVGDHHAIIPTDAQHDLGSLGTDERRLYDLVARRFLAIFHPDARFEDTVVWTISAEERFRSRGRVMLEAGWRSVFGEEVRANGAGRTEDDEDADQSLPALSDGQDVDVAEADVLAKQTKPPARFNEASLLRAMETAGRMIDDDELAAAMEESGLGTPATRAAHIEHLIAKDYVERSGKQLMATPRGRQLIRMLGDHPLTEPLLTGQWEQRLKRIERGEDDRDAFMRGIADFTREVVAGFGEKDRTAMKIERKVIADCPRCDGEIVERPKSWGCTSWKSKEDPGCGFVIWREQGRRKISVEEALERIARNESDSDRAAEREVLGPCPTPGCDGLIVERVKSYGCTSWKSRTEPGCGFVIWKSTRAGGDVDLETAREMVAAGKTNAAPAVTREAIADCPVCGGKIIDRGKGWGCDSWKSKKSPGCGTVIWKRQRERGELTVADALAELDEIRAAREKQPAAARS